MRTAEATSKPSEFGGKEEEPGAPNAAVEPSIVVNSHITNIAEITGFRRTGPLVRFNTFSPSPMSIHLVL
jgi:hypothetical protein